MLKDMAGETSKDSRRRPASPVAKETRVDAVTLPAE
jgi:hypothetical protein